MIHTDVPNAVTVIVNDEVHRFVVELADLVMRCLRVLLSIATFTNVAGRYKSWTRYTYSAASSSPWPARRRQEARARR
jgi:hypothetical protein